jgi:Cof subfamily protein (haloacid dehalogenase superfamily)
MKLFASDYDGTLKVDGIVSEADREAVRKWQAEGNIFVIDTGRSLESIRQETHTWGLSPDYYITNNGGMVFAGDSTELFSSSIDPVMSVDIMYIAHAVGHVVSYVVNDGIWRHRIVVDRDAVDTRYPNLEPDMKEEEVMDLPRHAQIVISMTSIEEARALAERINAHFPDKVAAYANRYVVDIVPYGMSKATGLEFLCQKLGIPVEDVYTAGDADNDIPLLHYGVHGTCMAASPEDVRKHAKAVCASVAELLGQIDQ